MLEIGTKAPAFTLLIADGFNVTDVEDFND